MNIDASRSDLRVLRHRDEQMANLEPGFVRFSVDSFGLTSNNITYAVFGDMMQYWNFFPVPEPDTAAWGRVPVWGFATVTESTIPELTEGDRYFGYFPMASMFDALPGRFDSTGFTDLAPHRQNLPSVYNRYSTIASDPSYSLDDEGFIMLLRPLFITSFVVDDFLDDHALFGAETVVISSASSKTSIAAAFLLSERSNVTVLGLTSSPNQAFVSNLDCYDGVFTYNEIASLPLAEAVYVDVAGGRDITRAVHRHFGSRLAYSMVVGDTHWDANDVATDPLVGPKPEFLFAPVQIAKRRSEWGRDGFEVKSGAAWNRFIPWTKEWMSTIEVRGVDEIERAYLDLLNGSIDPTTGYVCSFATLPITNER